MPVRNGQRFMREALDSILAQTFTDLEVIICDNASTDSTQEIAREYAARDTRVRYHRNPSDAGPARNFNMGFEMSRGEYFKWAAHDDVLAPDFLKCCVQALDGDASSVLAYPKTTIIDENTREMGTYDFALPTDATDPARRFAELVLVNHRKHRAVEIFGLMRASAVRQTPLQGSYARADSVFLARMALLGRFIQVPQRLFLSRHHATQSMQTMPSDFKSGGRRLSRYLGTGPLPPPEWWDSSRKGKLNFPEWNLMKEYWRSVGDAPISLVGRVRCHLVMLRWVLVNIPKLARDLVFALEHLVARPAGSGRPRSETQAV
jgi:glycosyltransferase involved in cell wall biosynthesis